jgi:hypothetical protein
VRVACFLGAVCIKSAGRPTYRRINGPIRCFLFKVKHVKHKVYGGEASSLVFNKLLLDGTQERTCESCGNMHLYFFAKICK